MISFNIRKATVSDLEKMHKVEAACFRSPWSILSMASLLGDNAYTVVAESDNEIIGFAGYILMYDEVNITNIAVVGDKRRNGVGAAMITALIDNAHNGGYDKITLEVRVSNKAAITLYEKFGFAAEGVRKKYYTDNNEDAIIMWLREN